METLKKIWEYIKNNWKNVLLILFAVVIVVLLIMQGCTRTENNHLKINVKALTDSVQVMETKNGELVYAKQALILEKNELEEYLNISKKERKELEKILDDKLSYIAKLEQTVRVDTFRCVDTMYVENGITHIGFNYKDKWVELDGETTLVDSVPQTQVNTLAMDAPLTVGLTDEYRIFVKTANPYVSFSNIEGAVIEKPSNGTKPKRWNIGIQVGIGGSYGLINQKFDFGPYIGAGISYGFGF